MQGLKARLAKGTLWTGIGQASEQITHLARNMILTRIIAPEAFGLIAIVMAMNAVVASFTQLGIKSAIVQNPEGDCSTFLNGAWWLSFVRVIGLYTLVFCTAPLLAGFYDNPELVDVMRVASLTFFFNGLISARAFVAIKQMRFFSWTAINHGGGIIGTVATIILGLYLKNVWALAIGIAMQGIIKCLLSFVICPFLPRFSFNKQHTKSLMKYIKGIVGLPILTFIFMRADIFVVGRVFQMENLGLYAMASSVAWMPFNFLTSIMSQVLMPALAENQKDANRLNRLTIHATSLIAFLGFPALTFVYAYGKGILSLLYGVQYGKMALPFAIVFSTALLRTCSVPVASLYLSVGRPELHRLFTATRAFIVVVLLYPFVKLWGLEGAALAGFFAMAVSYLIQSHRLRSVTGLRLRTQFGVIIIALVLSIPTVLFWYTSRVLDLQGYWELMPGCVGYLISLAAGLATLRSHFRKLREPSTATI